MPNVGPLELAIVLIIALVIFGPKKLPELGKSMGHGLREFKNSVTGDSQDDEEDDRPRTVVAEASEIDDSATADEAEQREKVATGA